MASIKVTKDPNPLIINKFLGINEDIHGETQLKLGESPDMQNFRVTENFKITKRSGYVKLFDSIGTQSIRAMGVFGIGAAERFVFAHGGNVYEHYLTTSSNVLLGTITDDTTSFFCMNSKVYMLNGHEYKSWDGTTFGTVSGYVPLIFIASPPSGGGTAYEDTNLLTGKKKQTFSPNGTATNFVLAETNIVGVDHVKILGTLTTLSYTVNTSTGIVTMGTAPSGGVPDSLEVQWDGNATDAAANRLEVVGNKYISFFGGQNDTRAFIWGHASYPNRRYYSYIFDMEYFPSEGFDNVGSDEFAITDISRQYDRQLVFKENEAFYSLYDETNSIFPTYNLNEVRGNVAMGQAQVLNNNPVTLQNGVYEWTQSNVRDERNAIYISKAVQATLDTLDLKTAITCDFENKGEYWIAVGKKVLVYNYRLGVWYKFLLADTPTCFMEYNKKLYFGTDSGQIMVFEDERRSDNGTIIDAYWESDFLDFNAAYLKKYLNRMWLSLSPEAQALAVLTYQTDVDEGILEPEQFTAEYNLVDFGAWDFGNFAFIINANPQPFVFKLNAKKFTFLKLRIEANTLDDTATILNMTLKHTYGGEVK